MVFVDGPATMIITRTLLAKELRQHGPALLGISALLTVAFSMGRTLMNREARVLSALEVVSSFALGPLVAAALYLGHRLVVAEHYGRTQRFVEALPVRRGHMALVKAAFGLAWLELWAACALLLAAASASTEPIGGRFLGILAARLGLYVFALWGVVFLLGFFGRLRLPLGGGLVLLAVLLDRATAWHLHNFGPLALVERTTFPFERQHFPAGALAQSAAVGAAALGIAWALSRVREGGIVEALARPLSRRELSAILVVAFGALTAFAALDREPAPPPYAFSSDRVLREGLVEIGYLDDDLRPAAAALSGRMALTLAAFSRALGVSFPPVRVVHGPEVPVDLPRVVRSHPTEGLVLRVNLAGTGPGAHTRVVALALHALVWSRSRGRAGLETKHWLLDGFAVHFAEHGLEPAPPPVEPDRTLLRALVATALVPFGEPLLRDYERTAERLGDDVTGALAASGWRTLESRIGRERALALARAALTRPGTGDVRDYLYERRHPMPRLFEEATGWAWPAFLQAWSEDLARLRTRPAARALLAELPQGQFRVRVDSPAGVAVEARLTTPLAADTTCTVRHRRLPPHDLPFSPETLEEVKFVWPRGERSLARPVADQYGPGERAFVALDCDLPELGCWARLAAERVTAP
jgi:hypothetical protein